MDILKQHMGQYIDAEKLIAEIERRMKIMLSVEGLVTGVADNMRYQDYKSLLSFIDSLQQEQQEVDLEKEYKEYVEDDPVFSKLVNHFAGMVIARHFYELGLNASKEE